MVTEIERLGVGIQRLTQHFPKCTLRMPERNRLAYEACYKGSFSFHESAFLHPRLLTFELARFLSP